MEILIQQFDSNSKDKLATNSIWDPTLQPINLVGVFSKKGATSKYYCGKNIGFNCGCCSGCGPTNGDNCLPCMILDVKSRNLPKGYLVNKFGATAMLKDLIF